MNKCIERIKFRDNIEANIFFHENLKQYNCNVIDEDGEVVTREWFDRGELYETVRNSVINLVTGKLNIFP